MRRFANWVRRWPASLRAGWMANRVRAGFALTILLLIVLINLAVFDPEATALIGRVWIVLLEAGALALLIGLLLWRWRQRDTVSVLPFQNLTGDESFAGVSAGFADLLTAEIQRIINLHEQTEWLGHRRQAPIPLREKSLPSRLGEATLSPIGASGGDLGETLENIGAVGVGPLNIPLGSLLAFVLRLFQPGTISGNFQMHDETLSIVVNLKARNRPTEKWVVKGKLGPNSTTVRELASELAYMMINDTSPSIARTVWQSFKAFSNGLEQYRSFLLSGGLDRQALDEARRHYETAVALEPSFALAHYNLGVVYEESGMPEATIEAYKQALSLDPRLAQAYHSLGLVHLNQNRLSEAVEALEQAVELDPTRPRFRQSLAVALSEAAVSSIELETERRIEFLEWATSLYEQAITGYRQIQADRDVRSEEEERLPPTDEAARWIRDNQAAAWRELGQTWLNLAHLYNQYEQEEPVIQALQQAQSAFLAALALNDRDADSWVVLGDLHHQLDNHEQAVAYFRKSLAIAPMGISAVDAHLGLGEVYLRHSDDILQYLEEAKAEEATREALPVWELDLAGKEFLDQAVAEFRAALDLHFAHWEWAVIEEGSGEMRHQAPPRAWELLDQLAAALLVPSALEDQNEAHSFTEFLALKPGEDALTPPLSELQAERNEAASRVLKWALALNPELPQVHDGLAALYELVGADEAAPAHVWLRDHCSTTDYPEVLLQVLEDKVNQTPEGDSSRGIYLATLGWLLRRQGKLKEAVGRLEEAMGADAVGWQEIPQVQHEMGLLYQEIKDSEKAIGAFQKADERYTEEERREHLRTLLHIGDLHYDAGDYDQAIEAYSRAHKLAGENNLKGAQSLASRGMAHWAKKKYAEAIADCQAAMKLVPLYSFARITLCRIYISMKDYERAIQQAQRMLQIEHGFAYGYWQVMGDAYYGLSQACSDRVEKESWLEKATRAYRRAAELCPAEESATKADVLISLATMLMERKQHAEAIQACEQALTLADEPAYHRILGQAHWDNKAFFAAKEAFEKAIELGRKKAKESQEEELRKQHRTEVAAAQNLLAYMYAEQGIQSRLGEAARLVDQALKAASSDTDEAAFLDTRGWIYFQQGKYDEALDDLEQSLYLDLGGSTVETVYHLARAYEAKAATCEVESDKRRWSAAARIRWKQVLEVEPEGEWAPEAKEHLTQLSMRDE